MNKHTGRGGQDLVFGAGQTPNNKPSDTMQESGAKPMLSWWGEAFMSAVLTWEWDVTQSVI